MKITLNREYAMRHLFTTVLMLGLGGWFGYDGFVGYPATPAADLYRTIEGSDAPAGFDLDAFKKQKIQTQYGFTVLWLAVAAVVGLRLLKSARFDCTFDDDGFTCGGVRHAFADVKKVDDAAWAEKGIVWVDGIVFDAWHHLGVKEFKEKLDAARGKVG